MMGRLRHSVWRADTISGEFWSTKNTTDTRRTQSCNEGMQPAILVCGLRYFDGTVMNVVMLQFMLDPFHHFQLLVEWKRFLNDYVSSQCILGCTHRPHMHMMNMIYMSHIHDDLFNFFQRYS